MKKINFIQKKYIVPLIVLPFIIFIAYMISTFKGPEKVSELVEMDEFNTNLQEPTNDVKAKTKFESMKDRLKKEGDFTGVQNIEVEEVQDEMIANSSSLYTTEEMRQIDSLNQVNAIQKKALQEKMESIYKSKDYTKETGQQTKENDPLSLNDSGEGELDPEQVYMNKIAEQRRILDSLAGARANEAIKEIEGNVKGGKGSGIDYSSAFNNTNGNTEIEEPSLPVIKAGQANRGYFNTINTESPNQAISAIIDESVKVIAGSRVRIRLLEDVTVGDYTLNQGQLLYGTVTGFSAQRVQITIESILIHGEPTKVKLAIYDLDGIEGLYVPASAFRDFTKQVGSKTASQNIQIESGGNNIESFAYKVLKDVYQSGTQAISSTIRQNKANIKYATQIKLINKE